MPVSEDFGQDAALLFGAVRRAGELGKALSREKVKRWPKSDGSEVTEADLQIDALLKEALRVARPSYGWLSEETPDDHARLSHERIWIIDPIDGTRAFINGKPEWCVAAALVENGRPAVAAVYCPMTEEFFSGIAGQGAHINSVAMTMADVADLAGARLMGNRKALNGLSATGIAADVSGSLPLQLRLAHVAAGRIDGAVSLGKRNDWDLAAGDLLVHEAGGLTSDSSGRLCIYNRPEPWQQGLVAAGAKRHAAIINAMRTP